MVAKASPNVLKYLAVLTVFIVPVALANEAKIMLFDHIIGPLVKTHSLELQPDGQVVDERYDISRDASESGLHSEVLCKFPMSDVDELVKKAASITERLPHVIDADRPLTLDGPSRSIRIETANLELRSSWNDPSDQNLSGQARQFIQVWNEIRNLLLGCKKS